jgi:hypothetical protein
MKKLLRKLTNVLKKRAKRQQRSEPQLPVVHISDTLLSETGRLIASFAEGRDSEGLVYWFGFEFGDKVVVTTLIVPNADTTYGCISTTPEANGEALGVIVGTPLVLLGQAHSHPGNGVRHSPFDDRETFARFDGAISVVIPYYARRGVNLHRCGVHRHISGAFQLINNKQLDEHIVVVPGQADLRHRRQRKIS